MRAADRHTVPPGDPQAGPTARPTRILPCRPDKHRPPCDQPYLAAPATAVHHATSLTLQTRQPPPAMRPAHLADPATAVRPSCRPSPYRPNRCRTTQAVPRKTDGCSTFTAQPPPSTAKRNRGDSRKGPQLAGVAEGRGAIGRARSRIRQDCGWQDPQPESRRVTGHSRKSPQLAGVAEGRGAIGRPAAVSGMGLRRVWRSFFAGFVPFASLNIRFERVQTASQPYFYSRKRFTPRPHTHQIQPVAAPRQRSAPAGGSRDRHPLRLEDSLPFRPSVRHPETHGSGCRFVGS